MKLERLEKQQAVNVMMDGGTVFMMTELTEATPIGRVEQAEAFVMIADDEEEDPEDDQAPEVRHETISTEPEEEAEEPTSEEPSDKDSSKVDHGKICALYKAGWKTSSIAVDVECSLPTVTNHLKKEGIWRGGK